MNEVMEKPMTVACAIETFDEIIHDIHPLLIDHWRELAAYPDIPLDPDYGFYRQANEAGLLRIYSARENGRLIGYCLMTLAPRHPHYQGHAFATADIVWVHPTRRNLKVGTALFDFIETDLRGWVIAIGDKTAHPALGLLLKARGYAPISTTWSRRL